MVAGGKSVADTLRCVSPGDGSLVAERPWASAAQISAALEAGHRAQRAWQETALSERIAMVERFVRAMEAQGGEAALEITRQMGRPIAHSPGEVRGLAERARYMAGIAEEALAKVAVPPKAGIHALHPAGARSAWSM